MGKRGGQTGVCWSCGTTRDTCRCPRCSNCTRVLDHREQAEDVCRECAEPKQTTRATVSEGNSRAGPSRRAG